MIKYFNNDFIVGWYFYIDGCYIGDGTKKGAYEAKKHYEEY